MSRRTFLRAATLGTGALAVAACGGGHDEGVTPARVTYGDDPSQWVDRYDVPAGTAVKGIGVAVIHGGFWRAAYDASLGAPLAADLARRGYRAWNVEYRRVGDGGGWPATLDDVAAALREVEDQRFVTVGHSAGGQLAVWAATQQGIGTRVVGAVSQAGVLDLVGAAREGVGGQAVPDLLGGGPDEVPDRYRAASPLACLPQLPATTPVLCVHGRDDDTVPLSQSTRYVDTAVGLGRRAQLQEVDGDHFVVIDTGSPAWTAVVDFLGTVAG